LSAYDGRTAAKLSTAVLHVPARGLLAAGRSVIVALGDGLAAVDPRTGRTAWRDRITARSIDFAELHQSTIWIHGTRPSGRDAVWRVQADSGRVSGQLTLPEFGASALAAVGDRLWVLTPGGRLLIVTGG
jgi:hypothetical protein